MSCHTCSYYQKPPRLGLNEVVGEKGGCHFGNIHRKVNPDESCAFDTTKDQIKHTKAETANQG